MKKLLILLFALGLLLGGFVGYNVGEIKSLEYQTCPMLKYPVVGAGNLSARYREWKHDLNGDGKADVVVLYVYSKTLERWVELDRKYLGDFEA